MVTGSIFNNNIINFNKEKSIRSAWEKAGKEKNNQKIDLSLGNPVDPAPDLIFSNMSTIITTATKKGFFGYLDNAGDINCRKAIAKELTLKKYFKKPIDPSNIIMTVGASGAANCTIKSLVNPGEEVIIISPYFVDYPKYILNHQANPKVVKLLPPDFYLDVNTIARNITKKTKAILVNSPNNPTGRVYTYEEISALSKILIKKSRQFGHPIFLLSDEVYREIVYPPHKFISPCAIYPNSIMLYSFSKSLNIAGERIGYAAINPQCVKSHELSELIKISNRILGFTNAPGLFQKIIPNLLPLDFNIRNYEIRKSILSNALQKAGFEFKEPEGTFYFFLKLPKNEKKFFFLSEKNSLFFVKSGPFGIPGFIRLAFCKDIEVINKAAEALLNIGKSL